MAYNSKNLLNKAKKVAKLKNLLFIEDVCVFIGISSSTFYDHFPSNSSEYKEIKDLITENVINRKHEMRNKWYESESATLQVALMKLIGSDRDRKRLTQSHQDLTTDGGKLETLVVVKDANS